MRLDLKHIQVLKKTLKDGTVKKYYRHRLAGKMLKGEPGTFAFMQSYDEASKNIKKDHRTTFRDLCHLYEKSPEFVALAPRTRQDYQKQIKFLVDEWGTMPIEALDEKLIRNEFIEWRNQIALESKRRADYAITVAKIIIKNARERNLIDNDWLAGIGRIYTSDRSKKVWTSAMMESIKAVAAPDLYYVACAALMTAQRQADLLAMRWADPTQDYIALIQQKTKREVFLPIIGCFADLLRVLPSSLSDLNSNPLKSLELVEFRYLKISLYINVLTDRAALSPTGC